MVATLSALLAGLVLGIWLQAHSHAPISAPAITFACLALALLGVQQGACRPHLRFLSLAVAIMPLAGLWAGFRSPVPAVHDPSRWAPLRHAVIEGKVAGEPRRLANGWRFLLAAENLVSPYPATGSGPILVRTDAPAAAALRHGQRLRATGALNLPPTARNPGEFDYRAYLARNGTFVTLNARRIVPDASPPSRSLLSGAIATKNEALALFQRHLPEANAALLGSLLFGDGASPIDPDTSERFRALGLAHVLAVSGAQILFLWALLRALILQLALPRWAGVASACGCLWLYAFMTGLPPSVIRATWMGCALVLGWAAERPWLRYLTLQAVVLGMLLYRPAWLFDVGFQFSAIATFALLHSAPKLTPCFRHLPDSLAQALAMALAAGAWVLPLQLAHFGQLSPYSLPLNALTCLLVEAVTILGFLAVLAGSVSELLAHHLLSGAYLLLETFTGLVAAAAKLPGASQYIRIPPAPWVGLAYLCTMAVFEWQPAKPPLRRWGIAALIATPVLSYALWDQLDRPRTLEVVALSIGQGDALVMRTPGNRWYLIDGGPAWTAGDAGARTVLPYLRRRGCRKLDGIIVSHAHDDHVGGLASIARGLPIAAVWDPGMPSPSRAYQLWLEQLLERQTPLIRVQAGMQVELEPQITLEVLGPPAQMHRGSRSDLNNNSVVLMLRHGSFKMLFAGDLEEEAEARMLRHGARLKAAVLKVAHHGSRFGSGSEFLRAVQPQASIISVGERNSFGHPAPETLSRLRPYGRVYRTDQDGAVTVTSDGQRWTVRGLGE